MSLDALIAYENFILEDPRSKDLEPHLANTLLVMAYKTLPKPRNPYVYFAGDELGAAYCKVHVDTFRNRRRDLEKLGLIRSIKTHAYKSHNKHFLLVCLLPEENQGMNPLPPLEDVKVVVEQGKGRSKGRSANPQRYDSVPSMNSEVLKIESSAEQFFNELISLLPSFFRKITYAKNLKKTFNDLAANYSVQLVAYYLKQKDLGSQPEAYLFVNFTKALEKFLEAPEQALSDFKKYQDKQASQQIEQAVKSSPLAPDKQAEFRAMFESSSKKNLEQS